MQKDKGKTKGKRIKVEYQVAFAEETQKHLWHDFHDYLESIMFFNNTDENKN